MKKVFAVIERLGPLDIDVLLIGETGTGKELVARALHLKSSRRDRPFVPVNCGAIAAGLMEDEFFGHERGAYTGALSKRIGRFEEAQSGTLFLDELNLLPLESQPKLLRAIQERAFRRVGGSHSINIDVRIVAASSAELGGLVRTGQFREDLYYRVNVGRIDLAPLRDRREDIPVLAQEFCFRYAARFGKAPLVLEPRAVEALLAYHWPGNVRELENAIERAVAMVDGASIQLEHLPAEVALRAAAAPGNGDCWLPIPRQQLAATAEKQYLLELMTAAKGDIAGAAQHAQLHRSTLYRLLRRHSINPADFRP